MYTDGAIGHCCLWHDKPGVPVLHSKFLPRQMTRIRSRRRPARWRSLPETFTGVCWAFYERRAGLRALLRLAQGWNLRHLDSLLSRTLAKKGLAIPGVSTPYLYFGMWRSIFAW